MPSYPSNEPYCRLISAPNLEKPILWSGPHVGTDLPPSISDKMCVEPLRDLPDTDWWLHHLYDWCPAAGITMLYARYSRYVVDLNRRPDSSALYSDGRKETGLVPIRTFSGDLLYRNGFEPNAEEVKKRVREYYEPYHTAIAQALSGLRKKFPKILLYEAHSIARNVASIQTTDFPDIMIGTVDGTSCDQEIENIALKTFQEFCYSVGVNSPFKGGYITRNFSAQDQGIHTLQIERSYDTYLDLNSSRPTLCPHKSQKMRSCLKTLFERITTFLST